MVSEVIAGGVIGIIGVIIGTFFGYCLEIHKEKIKRETELNVLKRQIIRSLRNSIDTINISLSSLIVLEKKGPLFCNSLLKALKKANFFNKVYNLEELIDELFIYHEELKELNDNLCVLMNQVRLFEASIDNNHFKDCSEIKLELEKSKINLKDCLEISEKI